MPGVEHGRPLVVCCRSRTNLYQKHWPHPSAYIHQRHRRHCNPFTRYHIALVISLSIPAKILEKWALTAMAVVMLVACVLVAAVPVKYKRR
jgi:hypothetical protein